MTLTTWLSSTLNCISAQCTNSLHYDWFHPTPPQLETHNTTRTKLKQEQVEKLEEHRGLNILNLSF